MVGMKAGRAFTVLAAIALLLLGGCESPMLGVIEKAIVDSRPVATPTFSITTGTYSEDQSVAISCSTTGAVIRYTTDGSTPSASSAAYGAPIFVSGDGTVMTISAIATVSGMADSEVASVVITIDSHKVSMPQFNPVSGTFAMPRSVTISCATPGATIRYTMDGTVPTSTNGTIYASPIAVGYTMTIKAYAFASGLFDSEVASATITLSPDVKWARSVISGTSNSVFHAVVSDSAGNVYAAGRIEGAGPYNFGGTSVMGAYSSGSNAILAKYDPSGNVLWVETADTGPGESIFYSLDVDSLGNVYVAGCMFGPSEYKFGDKTVTGSCSNNNALVVEYNSSGNALWAQSTSSGTTNTYYRCVDIDDLDNIVVVGWISGTETYRFGSPATQVAGTHSGVNVVIVKYDSSHTGQWARSVTAGSDASYYKSIDTDGSQNIYAAGSITGKIEYSGCRKTPSLKKPLFGPTARCKMRRRIRQL